MGPVWPCRSGVVIFVYLGCLVGAATGDIHAKDALFMLILPSLVCKGTIHREESKTAGIREAPQQVEGYLTSF